MPLPTEPEKIFSISPAEAVAAMSPSGFWAGDLSVFFSVGETVSPDLTSAFVSAYKNSGMKSAVSTSIKAINILFIF